MAVIEMRDVVKTFPPLGRKGDPVHAVRGVDLSIEAGEIHAIVGYSGAGKSTLVRLMNGLERATSGSVRVNGTELVGVAESDLRTLQRDIGMIFQQFNLFRSRTVWGNLEFPLKLAGTGAEQRRARISELLHFVGLADKAHMYPEQLSGGQKQRVGIARALATNPSLLLADESTSALDPDTTREVLNLLRRVNEEFGVTIVVITHEMDVVRTLAHSLSVMEAGVIVEQGPVGEVFARPQQPVTRRFLSTLVDQVPAGAALTALRARTEGRLVSIDLAEPESQTRAFAAFGEHAAEIRIVQGGVNQVLEEAFGQITVQVRGAGADAAVAALAGLPGVEVLA